MPTCVLALEEEESTLCCYEILVQTTIAEIVDRHFTIFRDKDSE